MRCFCCAIVREGQAKRKAYTTRLRFVGHENDDRQHEVNIFMAKDLWCAMQNNGFCTPFFLSVRFFFCILVHVLDDLLYEHVY
jgi:hypothetical protein